MATNPIFDETSGCFPAVFADVFAKTSKTDVRFFVAILLATKPDLSDKTAGALPAWSLHIIDYTS